MLTHVHVLGGFDLLVDGRSLAIPLQAQRVVSFLAVLGASRRDTMAGRLWPYSAEARAHANLRTALWRLRQAGAFVVHADQARLALDPSVDIDAERARVVARELEGSAPDTSPSDGRVQLFEHDLLPDWDEDWLVVERERIRQVRIHALEALSRHLLRLDRFNEAIDAALSAIAAEPLRESAHHTLITAYLAEGNPSEAVRAFDTYARLLRAELGLAPSSRLIELLADGGVSSRDVN